MASLVEHVLVQEAVDIGPSRSSRIGRVVMDLTAAEVIALNATPVTLVLAQGTGTVVYPTAGIVHYLPGGVAFGAASVLSLNNGGGAWMVTPATVPLNALVANVSTFSGADVAPTTDAENTPLTLAASGAVGGTGTGTVRIQVDYSVLELKG